MKKSSNEADDHACGVAERHERERLFMVKVPRGVDPRGALDSAMRSMRHSSSDEQEQSLAELRRKLEDFLAQCLKDEQYHSAIDMLDEHLPVGGQKYGDVRYGDVKDFKTDDEEEHPDHERLCEFAEHHGLSDDAAEDLHERRATIGKDHSRVAGASMLPINA
jgi:hypothetical protein